MQKSEMIIHSFVIRIWHEEAREETKETKWRGHITHIPSYQRHYVQTLDQISDFIIPYLPNMNARMSD